MSTVIILELICIKSLYYTHYYVEYVIYICCTRLYKSVLQNYHTIKKERQCVAEQKT